MSDITINETFTEEEYAKLMRIKKFIKLPWHDLLLKIIDLAEVEIRKQLSANGCSEAEINEALEAKP